MGLLASRHYSLKQVLPHADAALCCMTFRLVLTSSLHCTDVYGGGVAENFEQTHYFSTFANWIIPSHVVLGRYPYVEPGDPK